MKMKTVLSNTHLTVGAVRLSFVNIFEPRGFEGADPKYSVTILIDKKEETSIAVLSDIKKAIENAKNTAIEKGKFSKGFPKNGRTPLKDGDAELNSDGAPKHPGYYYIVASSNVGNPPSVVSKDKMPITDKGEVYGGCYAVVSLNFYGYDTPANKGVSCGLNHLMKVAGGEAFGSRISVDEAFSGFDIDVDVDEENFNF